MSKMTAMLYPFSLSAASIPRYRHMISQFELRALVSPIGLGLDGRDSGFVDEGAPTGMIVTCSFEDALADCDAVIAAEYEFEDNERFYGKVVQNLKLAMEKGKHVHCLLKLDSSLVTELEEHAKKYQITFIYYANPIYNSKPAYSKISYKKILQPDSPVITVLSLQQNCSKFEIQLAIRDAFIKKGFRVSQIGSKHYCGMFGFHSFPGFMFGNQLDEETKIFALNQFIRDIEANEQPDVIIIGVPGGFMRYNDRVINGFGITAYEVGCTVMPDFTLLGIPCDIISDDYITLLAETLKYRNGMLMDCLYMSNIKINEDSMNEQAFLPLTYDVMPDDYLDMMMAPYTGEPAPIYKVSDAISISEKIYAQLTDGVSKVSYTVNDML